MDSDLVSRGKKSSWSNSESKSGSYVRCGDCKYFTQFPNFKGHNTPQSLGKCLTEPWDGYKGQWPMLRHPCKAFVPKPQI